MFLTGTSGRGPGLEQAMEEVAMAGAAAAEARAISARILAALQLSKEVGLQVGARACVRQGRGAGPT